MMVKGWVGLKVVESLFSGRGQKGRELCQNVTIWTAQSLRLAEEIPCKWFEHNIHITISINILNYYLLNGIW